MNQIEKPFGQKDSVKDCHIDHWTARRLQRFANQHHSVQTCDRCWCRLRGGPPVPVDWTKPTHAHSVYVVCKCLEEFLKSIILWGLLSSGCLPMTWRPTLSGLAGIILIGCKTCSVVAVCMQLALASVCGMWKRHDKSNSPTSTTS